MRGEKAMRALAFIALWCLALVKVGCDEVKTNRFRAVQCLRTFLGSTDSFLGVKSYDWTLSYYRIAAVRGHSYIIDYVESSSRNGGDRLWTKRIFSPDFTTW